MQSNNKFKPYKKQEYLDSHYKINAKKSTSSYIRRTFRDNINKYLNNLENDIIHDKINEIYTLPYDYFY